MTAVLAARSFGLYCRPSVSVKVMPAGNFDHALAAPQPASKFRSEL
jgi:hypothetical protein